MPNQTTNYKLIKPLPSELYSIEVFNENMDIIDDTLKKHIDGMTPVCLWSGDVGNGANITLNESIWNYKYAFAVIGQRETALNPILKDTNSQKGFSATEVDDSKRQVTYSASVTFAENGLSATIGKCVYVSHAAGNNHPGGGDARVNAIYGVKND